MNFSRTRLSLQEVFNKCLPVMSIQAIPPPFPQVEGLQRIDLYSHYIFQIQPNCQICIYIFTIFGCLLIYQLLILHVRKIKTRDNKCFAAIVFPFGMEAQGFFFFTIYSFLYFLEPQCTLAYLFCLFVFILLPLIYNYMQNIMFTRLPHSPCPPPNPHYCHCPSAQ